MIAVTIRRMEKAFKRRRILIESKKSHCSTNLAGTSSVAGCGVIALGSKDS